ncbi:MAG: Bug family tripartite tricarboxylate transporter substrate binding protein [Betaproteobacteria bacterium]
MRTILACLLIVAGAVHTACAHAQTSYPSRAVRMLVGFAPGGTTDIIARLLAPELSEHFDRQFYVENRPGATGNIATDLAVKSAPDGTTLLVVSAAFASNVSVYSRASYDPLRDFSPITRVAAAHNVLVVHRSLPVKTLKELIALVKRYPGELSFGSPGHGSTPHLALELLKMRAAPINVLHVPYRGMAPAVLEVVGGQVHAAVSTLPPAIAHIRGGRLRPLAIASLKRFEALPDVPTFSEAGYPGFEAAAWNAVLAPAGTPYDVVTRLHLAIVQIARSRPFSTRLQNLGADIVADTPDQFTAYLRSEVEKWAKVVERTGARID